ncbi:nicotinate phosphoribosyltransferase [Testudinibacter aquarius]|uniref:nicotinate phosphoribosyltransferase n=1 Tax=Testudinibacter aquarius TaxID=1524974 RepID=A0A4R3Y6U1_9PAST|nr:nicotinate phosphoribosyltransferase [Testudinibacter aquarius]KAE9529213.1 nicotinate phosphoribosyltransferase [Testudinibacter aquarius]TCV87332.1 nicotinate phosphoribosyltransferase [Testudinibacter aquarius]TNG92858.1 nicotinate phosphoribosyltransferase [Testudinibacter aquarius]
MCEKEFELKQKGKLARLTNRTFKFDPRIKDGWFSAVYFLKTSKIVANRIPRQTVSMQFFQKNEAIVCGMDEAIALLHTFAANPQNLKIWALNDGDKISPFETVLMVEGYYEDFGYLEGIIDGILARRTSVATHVYNVVQAASGKQVIFMGDRDDHFSQQAGDGYAAYIGGMSAQATYAMNEWWGSDGVGTMPHALIQLFNGDLIQACEAYLATFPEDNLVALVDYNNDVIEDSLKVARHFGNKLYGVRVDTSANMVDQYFLRNQHEFGQYDLRGTNPRLIKLLRRHLDAEGFQHVKIIVSGGFDSTKIRLFEQLKTPVDSYGVGSNLLKVNIGFTGDCVRLNGKEQAKQGRRYQFNPRLQPVRYAAEQHAEREE